MCSITRLIFPSLLQTIQIHPLSGLSFVSEMLFFLSTQLPLKAGFIFLWQTMDLIFHLIIQQTNPNNTSVNILDLQKKLSSPYKMPHISWERGRDLPPVSENGHIDITFMSSFYIHCKPRQYPSRDITIVNHVRKSSYPDTCLYWWETTKIKVLKTPSLMLYKKYFCTNLQIILSFS